MLFRLPYQPVKPIKLNTGEKNFTFYSNGENGGDKGVD